MSDVDVAAVAEREAVVRWLRDLAVDCPPVIDKFMDSAANSIERGDHHLPADSEGE